MPTFVTDDPRDREISELRRQRDSLIARIRALIEAAEGVMPYIGGGSVGGAKHAKLMAAIMKAEEAGER